MPWNPSDMDAYREDMVRDLMEIISIPALSPKNGGKGEGEKADKICEILDKYGIEYRRYDTKDDYGVLRPNIVASVGEGERNLWIVTHMDVVPPGSRELWSHDPFKPIYKDGKIYGRGSEDNGQAIISSIHAARCIVEKSPETKYRMNLAIVADEETGNIYGIKHLAKEGIFSKEDIVIVPDAGTPKGDCIEIAEKSILWLKIIAEGKQVHASMPHLGLNAHRLNMEFAIHLDKILHEKFADKNELFSPPESTFEPTKHVENVENVNTIPGRDEIYFDCRVLPEHSLDEIISLAKNLADEFSRKSGGKISVETPVKVEAPPPTPPDSEVVRILKQSIKKIRGIDARPIGIGGGTCAAIFRRMGIHTAVWETIDEVAHQPNEYCIVDNMVNDAKVFADIVIL